MKKSINAIKKRVNGLIWALVGNGILLLILGVLAVWSTLFLKLIIGLVIIVIAFMFFAGAYKIWKIKRDIEKIFKI
jgi:ABC-type antimicrobial peptide transport system permease subunit